MNILQKLCITLLLCMTMIAQARAPCRDCSIIPCQEPIYTTCFPSKFHCPPCTPAPCEPKKNKNLGLYALGAALLGTGAGVGIGYAAGNNNRHHSHSHNDPCCPPNAISFPPEEQCPCARNCGGKRLKNSVLNFAIDFTVNFTSTATPPANSIIGTIAFFAVTPNGCTIQGEPMDIQSGGIFTTAPVSASMDAISDLTFLAECCGTYQIGATLNSSFPITMATLLFEVMVASNCPNQNTVGIGLSPTNLLKSASPDQTLVASKAFNNSVRYSGDPVSQVQFQLGQYEFSPHCCILDANCSCTSTSSSCSCE